MDKKIVHTWRSSTSFNGKVGRTRDRHQTKYMQRRPFNAPLPYRLRDYKQTSLISHGSDAKLFNRYNAAAYLYKGELNTIKASNNALSELDGKLRTAESFFEDWYERQQSIKLIKESAKAVLSFVSNWRNPKYWKHLAKDRRPADLPSAWLAYQFGVKPLIGGIDRGMKLLGREMPQLDVYGTGGQNDAVTVLSPANFRWTFGPYTEIRYTFTTVVKLGCTAYGINPNKALSGATGLGEPFSSAWNVIPWGWAVDYFINVGELLSNVENKHPGVRTKWFYKTTLQKATWSHSLSARLSNERTRELWGFSSAGNYVTMDRTVSRLPPRYRAERKFPPLGGNQLANLMSAIALTMKGKKK